MWTITIGHLEVLQVLLHQIFGDEPSGLPKDQVLPPSIDPEHTEEFPDLLGGLVPLHENEPQERHEETGLGRPLLITWTFVTPEAELADEDIDVPAVVHFLQLQAKHQLHALKGSPEDLREVLPVLPVDDRQQGVLSWAPSCRTSPAGTPPACWPSWSEDH